jgi:hypothetical protein
MYIILGIYFLEQKKKLFLRMVTYVFLRVRWGIQEVDNSIRDT